MGQLEAASTTNETTSPELSTDKPTSIPCLKGSFVSPKKLF